ncbi:MAG: hypothetical protein IJX98_04700 [Clostridia bacterium]|nr:hypothetical protein [Clostridia bacterium]
MTKKAKWIWRYGDYEIFHNVLLHMRRKRYGVPYPALWALDSVEPNVLFTKKFVLEEPTKFTVFTNGLGQVRVNRQLYPVGEEIVCSAGEKVIDVLVTNPRGLPAAFVVGEKVFSDESWFCDDKKAPMDCVGCSPAYYRAADNVEEFPFALKKISVFTKEETAGGCLYDFGKETYAFLVLENITEHTQVYFGESREEALDTQYAYLRETVLPAAKARLEKRAFRFAYVCGKQQPTAVYGEYEYLPMEKIGGFSSDDEELNTIYQIGERTLELCAREFYIDGIKRDHWVWSGDAYQAFMIHNCLFADREIVKRTITALLGKPPYRRHVNTINDYSLYLIVSAYDYYFQSGDAEFVRKIWARLKELYAFCVERLDENGFVCKRQGDWIFVDWSNTLDKDGPPCALQILLWKANKCMRELAVVLGDRLEFLLDGDALKEKIFEKYYDGERGAFIDGFTSGKRMINRQQNVFAVLYGFTNEAQTRRIVETVLCGDAPAITTPFFKFFELAALGKCGKTERVFEFVKAYWGGMVKLGATSFWEEYDPTKTEHYAMYGDKYGKSLCHVWGSGPVYLMINYLAGIQITSVGGATYEVKPCVNGVKDYTARMPVSNGWVEVEKRGARVNVYAMSAGGTLILDGKRYLIEKEKQLTVEVTGEMLERSTDEN